MKRECMPSIGGNPIEHVQSFSQLGHIITADMNDREDVLHRRNCFVGQANNMLCFLVSYTVGLLPGIRCLVYTVTADMDVSYRHWITVILMNLVRPGEKLPEGS